jgi:hypothetical protein
MSTPAHILEEILKITQIEFEDIIDSAFFLNYKLRLVLKDKSFVDVGISKRIPGRFSFHWECKNDMVYRYDNFPDEQWNSVETYPFHFHNGSQDTVDASPFSTDLIIGFREFMEFVKEKI